MTFKNTIATINIKMAQHNSSIKILESITTSTISKSNPSRKARFLGTLGYSYFKTKRNSEEIQLMTQSLAIRKKSNDFYEVLDLIYIWQHITNN
ncbi:hypothetical protein [Flavobacterium fryxellicola]|uniref:Uncharacterized protein n=1 Tax=Flavobacterium fryxellicola TaxID=249352 RepID=A0A167Y0R9_9FLAO|nr:hypothetical protein [Flavobacterium fryxellicola]OAB28901.1 hypothetical protein FBFR_05430 [Flavobacterium fryxellicola]